MTSGDLIEQGIQMVKAGDRRQAQALLTEALKQNPREARAWLWLAACLDDPARQRFCLEKAQALQPDNPQIQRALEQLAPSVSVAAIGAGDPTPPEALNQATSPSVAAIGDSGPATPGSPTPATNERAPTAARRRLSAAQSCLLALVALMVIAGLAAAALIVLPGLTGQAIDWNRLGGQLGLSAPPSPPQSGPRPAAGGAPATLALPEAPTWTPASTPEPGPTATLRPTLDWGSLGATQINPLPSITPLRGYSRLIIGRSVENRGIEVYRFGAGRRERMIIAGIHGGDEYNTIQLADALIEHLGENPDAIPQGYTLYILRALNPDGAAAGRDPENRLNANGVDLNRNFDTNWKADWRSEGCASLPGTGGGAPGSEPETQAVKQFLRGREIEALIVYHSAGLGVFPSGDPAHPDSVRLAQAIAGISNYAYPPLDTGCEYTGTLVDWAANAGIPAAVDLELNSATEAEFEANLKVLELLLSFEVQRPAPTLPPTLDPALLATLTRSPVIHTPTPSPSAVSPSPTP